MGVDGMEASEHSSHKLPTEDGGRRGIGVSVLGKYFGVSPMAVKACCMACQGGWGYLLCKSVIFK